MYTLNNGFEPHTPLVGRVTLIVASIIIGCVIGACIASYALTRYVDLTIVPVTK